MEHHEADINVVHCGCSVLYRRGLMRYDNNQIGLALHDDIQPLCTDVHRSRSTT
jgi:hypothetical protein